MSIAESTGQRAATEPTSLYRFFDAEDRLLYVGITRRGGQRFYEHAKDKAWWPTVTRTTVEHFDTRDAAIAAESRAIREESPQHNVQGAGFGSRGTRTSRPARKQQTSRRWRVESLMEAELVPGSLVGSYFHSYIEQEDGVVRRHWQGMVVGEPSVGVYLVQLYSWMDGAPSDQKLIRIEDMALWTFYDDADVWREKGDEPFRGITRGDRGGA